jgi:hypothetical protein
VRTNKLEKISVVDQIGLEVAFYPTGPLAEPIFGVAVSLFESDRIDDSRLVAFLEQTGS